MIELKLSHSTWHEVYHKIRAAGQPDAVKSEGCNLAGIELNEVWLPFDRTARSQPEQFPGSVSLALPWRMPDTAPRDGQHFLGLFRVTIVYTDRPAEYRHYLRVVHRQHFTTPSQGSGYWADQWGNSIPDSAAFTFWTPLGHTPMEPYDRERGKHGDFVDWSKFGGDKPASAR